MTEPTPEEARSATRNAVRDILLGTEGQMLMTRVAEEASLRALTDFMLKIGMDTTSPQAIIALQNDMQHLRWWNKFVNSALLKIILAVVGLSAMGGYASLLARFKEILSP